MPIKSHTFKLLRHQLFLAEIKVRKMMHLEILVFLSFFYPVTKELVLIDLSVITMKLPESNLVGMDASISISHMVSDRSTNAFLLCRHWHQALYISEIVISHAAALTHPAALPSILCNLYQSVLLRRISSTWGDVFKVELKGGRSGITLFDPSRRRLSSENSDDPELSRAAIKVAQLSAA